MAFRYKLVKGPIATVASLEIDQEQGLEPQWLQGINSSKPEMPHRWSWAARQDNRFWRQPQPVPKV